MHAHSISISEKNSYCLNRLIGLVFLTFCCCSNSFSQIENIKNPSKNNQVTLNFECREKNFKFKSRGRIFSDKDKAYYCPISLPDTVEVVDLMSNPIPYNVTWTGDVSNPNSINNYSATIESSHFNSGQGVIIADFIDINMVHHTMTLKIRQPSSFELANDNNSKFAFDSNQIMDYPTYNTFPSPGIWWKFLETGVPETMEGLVSPNPGFPAIQIQSSNSTLSIQPDTMSSKNETISFFYPGSIGGSGMDSISITGCGSDPELKTLAGDKIQKTVNFIYVCDSITSTCPPNPLPIIGINQLIAEANAVLNKAGHYIGLGAIFTDTIPYDFNQNGTLSPSEQLTMHNRYTGTPFFASDYLVMIVDNIGGATEGRATLADPGMPSNSLVLDANKISSGGTLAHEIGYAAYQLSHPDNGDTLNFMYFTSTGRINNIRAYQFQEIHKIR